MKPRVCLIYTGGTIGMTEEDGERRPPDRPEDFLKIAPDLPEFVEIVPVFTLNKDSTNMHPGDWEAIARAIYERKDDGYQGFVVAHGTDTMHFTASALAFALGPKLRFPVVLTGAQTIPAVRHGDARVNLLRACRTALEPIAEVCISFGDYVFRGCRAQKKDERRFDAFESPAFPVLAYITEGIDIQPLARLGNAVEAGPMDFRPHFASGVLQVSLIPGLEPELLLDVVHSKECKGVILQSFGAGNVPDMNAGPYSFDELIRNVVAQNTPVIITSQFPAGSTLTTSYAPGLAAVRAGAIPTGNMTSSCAAVKFRWVLAYVQRELNEGKIRESAKIDRIRQLMGAHYVGDTGLTTAPFTDEDVWAGHVVAPSR